MRKSLDEIKQSLAWIEHELELTQFFEPGDDGFEEESQHRTMLRKQEVLIKKLAREAGYDLGAEL